MTKEPLASRGTKQRVEKGAKRTVVIPICTAINEHVAGVSLSDLEVGNGRRDVEVIFEDPLDLDLHMAKIIEESAFKALAKAGEHDPHRAPGENGPEELLYKEFEGCLKALVIGCKKSLER